MGDRTEDTNGLGDLVPEGAWGDKTKGKRGWRIQYRMRDPRTGRLIRGRMAAFSKGVGSGWIKMATDTELRPGTPVVLELSLSNGTTLSGANSRCTIARGRVLEVGPNPDPDESQFIIKLSVETVERAQAAA
jgi:hypothetical protein